MANIPGAHLTYTAPIRTKYKQLIISNRGKMRIKTHILGGHMPGGLNETIINRYTSF